MVEENKKNKSKYIIDKVTKINCVNDFPSAKNGFNPL